MQTEVATAKWETIFELKDKGNRFQITVKLGECEDVFAIQWYYNQLAKSEGGSVGDSYTSEFGFSSRETAIKTVIGKVNRSIMKHLPHFKGYGWAGKFLDKNPEASPNYRAPEAQYLEHINEMRGFEVQTETAASEPENPFKERLTLALPDGVFQELVNTTRSEKTDLVSCQTLAEKNTAKGLYVYEGKSYIITGSASSGAKGYSTFFANEALLLSECPKHYLNLYKKGVSGQSYVGMKVKVKDVPYIMLQPVNIKTKSGKSLKPEEKTVKPKPKAATPKKKTSDRLREYHFEDRVFYVNPQNVCTNPEKLIIFENKQWSFAAHVAYIENGWRNGYWFTGPQCGSTCPVTTAWEPFNNRVTALADSGNIALEFAIKEKAPAAAIKAIQEFISHNRQLVTVGDLVKDIEVNGINEAKTEEPEPVKTELVDGHKQIVLFDVPATKPKQNLDAALFGYVAKNRTERQAFKRKLERTKNWLDELPADQRAAILKAIAAYTPPRKR